MLRCAVSALKGTRMAVRKLPRSWQYDFTISGFGRHRQGGFRTKNEALLAEKAAREALLSGARQLLFREGYDQYMAATRMKDRARDSYERLWGLIEPKLGHRYIEEVDTSALDAFKQTLPTAWAPKTINQPLILIRAVLRFLWRRGRLRHVPYVPMESVPTTHTEWYSESERDQLLDGMFQFQPQWYLFFYLTARLGLRTGEVYAITHGQIRREPPQLVVDRAVQRGTKKREAKVVGRKGNDVAVLELTDDILAAVDWHCEAGHAGEEYLFSKTGEFPRYIDSHVGALTRMQKKLGLRELSHHKLGRHSVASQAVTNGTSVKAVQAQLGHRSEASTHKYAHLGSAAQKRLMETLTPKDPPHAKTPCDEDSVNVRSTDAERSPAKAS